MRIDVALKERFNISRQKARELIEADKVSVNGKPVSKPALNVDEDDKILIESSDILKYVGRGGLKLEKALNAFGINPGGMICLDIGASTGGFTDCLLQRGADRVYALDVGTSQLAQSLRADSRVVSMENTDIRNVQLETVDFICMDVSFISVTKVMHKVSELLKDKGIAVILIKPQFEAGREYLSKNGIVKNFKVHKKVIREVIASADNCSLGTLGLIPSPIKGGDGNTEYLLYLVKNADNAFALDIDMVVRKAEENK